MPEFYFTNKRYILTAILLIIYLLILLYLYNVFLQLGAYPYILIIIFIFVFLITISPFFRQKNRRSFYSRLFPDRKRHQPPKRSRNKKRIRPIEKKKPLQTQIQPKIYKPIDLEVDYRIPLISNCENCGNILPNFVKDKCPFCGEKM